jgi:hypothetical protein
MSFKQRNEAYLYKNCKKLMIFIFTLNLFITKIVQNIMKLLIFIWHISINSFSWRYRRELFLIQGIHSNWPILYFNLSSI